MKPEHIVAKNISWASDILQHVQVIKPDPKQFFYDPIRKIVAKSLNPDSKGMIGCFSSEIIHKMTSEISKSLSAYLLSHLNSIINAKAKSIKQLFDCLETLNKEIPSYSNKVISSVYKPSLKATAIQTQPYIISITPVVSVGVQTVQSRPNSKSVVISNNFKVKSQVSSQHNFQTDRQFELQSVVNKQSRLFFHSRPQTKKNSITQDLYSKSYQMKKWSMENIKFNNLNDGERRSVAPSYYPSHKNSRAKFYYDKPQQRRNSTRELTTTSELL